MNTYLLIDKDNPDNSITIKAESLIEAFKEIFKNGSCMAWCLGDFESDDVDFCAKEIYLFNDWEEQGWLIFELKDGILEHEYPPVNSK